MKALVLILALTALAAAQTPRAEIAESLWDFGVVEQGDTATKLVPIKNVGDRTLNIYRVRITCGCLNGWAEKKKLEPGEECNIVVKLTTERRVGKIVKSVFVETNDMSQRKLEVKVVGEIRAAWWPSVAHLSLGRIERGLPGETEFEIRVRPGTEMNLVRAASSVAWVKIDTVPFGETDGDHGWIVKLDVAANAPMGRLVASILIETDWAEFPRQNVAVTGEVIGPITVAPARIQFGTVAAGETKSVVVTISRSSGKGLELTKVNCLDADVKTEIVEKTPGAVYEIHVSLTPERNRRRLAGRLYVHTNLDFQKVITITYTGTIAD